MCARKNERMNRCDFYVPFFFLTQITGSLLNSCLLLIKTEKGTDRRAKRAIRYRRRTENERKQERLLRNCMKTLTNDERCDLEFV